jgi:Zn finger protein HypA/HybF involved in hydrogenase expression
MCKTEIDSKPLTGDCEGCGAPGALYFPSRDDYRCPDCAGANERYRAAWRHLEDLTEHLFLIWEAL